MKKTFLLVATLYLSFSLNAQEEQAQKMAHLNADDVVTAFPKWIKALNEAAARDVKQQQLLAQCAAEFKKVQDEVSAMDFSQMTSAQKDSVFKARVFSKGQECEKIRGGLMQNSKDNVPEDLLLFQQVMDKVLDHFKAEDGYTNIYPMAGAQIQTAEIQESIKYYKSVDITETFVKVMKAHVAKSESLKAAAASEVDR